MGFYHHSLAIFLLALFACTPMSLADTRLFLPADQDLTVSELHPYSAQREMTKHSLDSGVGRGIDQTGRSVSYLRFKLTDVPRSGWLNTVLVDSAQLNLFALSHGLTPAGENFAGRRYLASVSSCDETIWSELKMTWDSRVCKTNGVLQDTQIADADRLPAPVSWDVTQVFSQAVFTGEQLVTLLVEANRLLNCSRDPLEGLGCQDVEQVGFLRFASKEREFGSSIVPRVSLTYSKQPTLLKEIGAFLIGLLSVTATLVGLYTAFSGEKKAGRGK